MPTPELQSQLRVILDTFENHPEMPVPESIEELIQRYIWIQKDLATKEKVRWHDLAVRAKEYAEVAAWFPLWDRGQIMGKDKRPFKLIAEGVRAKKPWAIALARKFVNDTRFPKADREILSEDPSLVPPARSFCTIYFGRLLERTRLR